MPSDDNYLRLIDRNTIGNRCDVTPLLSDADAFSKLLDNLIEQCEVMRFDAVAGLDALGFIIATGIAVRLRKRLVILRKGGKLPVEAGAEPFVDYSGTPKSLEMRPDAVTAGMRVLIVDDWIETGAQARAAISLIERHNGQVAGIAAINIDSKAGAEFKTRGYPCIEAI